MFISIYLFAVHLSPVDPFSYKPLQIEVNFMTCDQHGPKSACTSAPYHERVLSGHWYNVWTMLLIANSVDFDQAAQIDKLI